MRRTFVFVAALLALLIVFLLPSPAQAQLLSSNAFLADGGDVVTRNAEPLKARVGVLAGRIKVERMPTRRAPDAPRLLTLDIDEPDDRVLLVSRGCGALCDLRRGDHLQFLLPGPPERRRRTLLH